MSLSATNGRHGFYEILGASSDLQLIFSNRECEVKSVMSAFFGIELPTNLTFYAASEGERFVRHHMM